MLYKKGAGKNKRGLVFFYLYCIVWFTQYSVLSKSFLAHLHEVKICNGSQTFYYFFFFKTAFQVFHILVLE